MKSDWKLKSIISWPFNIDMVFFSYHNLLNFTEQIFVNSGRREEDIKVLNRNCGWKLGQLINIFKSFTKVSKQIY